MTRSWREAGAADNNKVEIATREGKSRTQEINPSLRGRRCLDAAVATAI
jgi:hypothetical protein